MGTKCAGRSDARWGAPLGCGVAGVRESGRAGVGAGWAPGREWERGARWCRGGAGAGARGALGCGAVWVRGSAG